MQEEEQTESGDHEDYSRMMVKLILFKPRPILVQLPMVEMLFLHAHIVVFLIVLIIYYCVDYIMLGTSVTRKESRALNEAKKRRLDKGKLVFEIDECAGQIIGKDSQRFITKAGV